MGVGSSILLWGTNSSTPGSQFPVLSLTDDAVRATDVVVNLGCGDESDHCDIGQSVTDRGSPESAL